MPNAVARFVWPYIKKDRAREGWMDRDAVNDVKAVIISIELTDMFSAGQLRTSAFAAYMPMITNQSPTYEGPARVSLMRSI
jgi:hypothetical protein